MFHPDTVALTIPYLLSGLKVTLLLAILIVPLAFGAGTLVAIVANARSRPARIIAYLYIDFFRAFPPLVLIIFVFYALPFLGLRLPEIPAFVLAMTLNGSAYFAEIVRAGLAAVPKGQYEAAQATGLNGFQVLAYVVLPQALKKVRPPLLSNVLELAKATSLASVVAIAELLRTARIAQGAVYDPTPLLMAALVYLAMFWPFVRLLSLIEKRQSFKPA